MAHIKEVNVEFLRRGPAHNRLLSPLTNYLALCGEHAAETVKVPFEHYQLLHKLNALSYVNASDEARQYELGEMANDMAGLFSSMPGLIASLSDNCDGEDTLRHLRLMVSASELAMLPFELANTPNGIPGSGQPLLLQTQSPVCMTRRVRRASVQRDYWERPPKILFIAAAPGEMSVPVKAHLYALRKEIKPWVRSVGEEDRRKEVEKHLFFLPNADLQTIEYMCRRNHFTHVHILAHGGRSEGEHKQYGLLLHKRPNSSASELITGERLAAALIPFCIQGDCRFAGPIVVSLASCDTGAVGNVVVEAGISVAHQLHEQGVPLVLASQFPLSKRGSVLMVERLYRDILWGKDPRKTLIDLRRQLFAQLPDYHDWASLVAYDAFPDNLEERQAEIGIEQANRAIRVALDIADESMEDSSPDGLELEKARKDLRRGVKRLNRYIDQPVSIAIRNAALGMRASAEKREANILHKLSELKKLGNSSEGGEKEKKGEVDFKKDMKEMVGLLQRAMADYERLFRKDLSSHWAITQYLSLMLVIQNLDAGYNEMSVESSWPEQFSGLWMSADTSARLDLDECDIEKKAWAYGSLAELAVIKQLALHVMKLDVSSHVSDRRLYKQFSENLDALIGMGDDVRSSIYSTIMQLKRYSEWYRDICSTAFHNAIRDFSDGAEITSEADAMKGFVERVSNLEERPYKWRGD